MRNGLYSCTQDGLKLGSGMSFWAVEWMLKKDSTAASSRAVKCKLNLFIRPRSGAILPDGSKVKLKCVKEKEDLISGNSGCAKGFWLGKKFGTLAQQFEKG